MAAKGQFISGLLGGYSQLMLQKQLAQHQEDLKQKEARAEYLKVAIASGQLTDEARDAAFQEWSELTEGTKGKGKGGGGTQHLKTLVSRLTGHAARGQMPQRFEERPSARGGTPGQLQTATGSIVDLGAPPTRPGEAPTLQPVPTRPPMAPHIFKTSEEQFQEQFGQEKRIADYQHRQRLEEIEKQYGEKLTFRSKVSGAGIPPYINADNAGNPIDRSGKTPYTLAERRDGTVVAAIPEFQKPEKPTGPEAKIQSMAQNIMADAQAKGKLITLEQATTQARQMAVQDARAAFLSRMESLRGKQLTNRIRAKLAGGEKLTPSEASALKWYIRFQAQDRYDNDQATIDSGKTKSQIEDDIMREIGITPEQLAGIPEKAQRPGLPSGNSNPFGLKP